MSAAACPRQDPHPSHFWHEPGWKPPHMGARQWSCAGVEDPAVQAMTEEQLRMAQHEMQRRQDAARQLREAEERRHRQMRETELSRDYRNALEALLAEKGIRPPPGPGFDRHEQWEPVLAGLLEDLSDLIWDYREAKENL